MAASKVIKVAQPLLGVIGSMSNNWNAIEPLILGVAVAFGVYEIAVKGVETATNALKFAQEGLKAIMGINKMALVIIAIIAVIAVIHAVIAVINKVNGTSISALGIICGAIAVAGAFIWNVIVGVINAAIQYLWTRFVEPFIGIIEFILNVFNGGFNSFGEGVANLIGQIISWFMSMGKVVTKIIDAIFGTDWTAGLSSLQNDVLGWGKNETAITLDRTAPELFSQIEYGDAWDSGNQFGTGIEDKLSSLFGGVEDANSVYESDDYENLVNNTADTAANTGNMAGSMEISDENLKYMRDAAEMEAINRYTTAQFSVDFKNTATINSDMDIDGVMNKFTEKLRESVDTCAEEVHYIV